MRILLTAFEPFDGTGLNSSLEACRIFLEEHARGLPLRFAVLPVEYGRDTEAVERALAEWPAELVFHTGQATGAEEVRVERLAVNVRYAGSTLADRHGPQHRIEPEGPAALFSTLPVDPMAEAIAAAGVPARVSNHAGIYLCNHVLYQSLLRAERRGSAAGEVRVGFLHLPCLPEQAGAGGASMDAGKGARAISLALQACGM